MSRLYVFADDSMLGRETGTEGNVRGTNYIAAEAKRIGLIPAGENGTYFQTLPFKSRVTDSTSTIRTPTASLAYGSEWAARLTSSLSQDGVEVIYGGTVGDTATVLTDDQVNGKLVVFTFPTTPGTRMSLRSVSRMGQHAAAVMVVGPDPLLNQLKRPSTVIDWQQPGGA